MFRKAAFGYLDVGYSDERETIILRDENKKPSSTKTGPAQTDAQLMKQYNELLERTFIDIQLLDKPRIELPEKRSAGRTTGRSL